MDFILLQVHDEHYITIVREPDDEREVKGGGGGVQVEVKVEMGADTSGGDAEEEGDDGHCIRKGRCGI